MPVPAFRKSFKINDLAIFYRLTLFYRGGQDVTSGNKRCYLLRKVTLKVTPRFSGITPLYRTFCACVNGKITKK